jgi:hypothetical protein
MSRRCACFALVALVACGSQEAARDETPREIEAPEAPEEQAGSQPVMEAPLVTTPDASASADEAPESRVEPPPARSAAPRPSAPPGPPIAPAPHAEPERKPEAAAPAKPAGVDLENLTQRLKDTSAIGVFTKLELKRQIDELVEKARASHTRGVPTLEAVHERFDGLVLKLLTLLEDDEPKLAAEVAASRESLWAMLADPDQVARL